MLYKYKTQKKGVILFRKKRLDVTFDVYFINVATLTRKKLIERFGGWFLASDYCQKY